MTSSAHNAELDRNMDSDSGRFRDGAGDFSPNSLVYANSALNVLLFSEPPPFLAAD